MINKFVINDIVEVTEDVIFRILPPNSICRVIYYHKKTHSYLVRTPAFPE